MNFEDSCQALSSTFELLTHIQQVKFNKLKKSIYGLSYDYVVWTWLSFFTSVISSINFYINPEVIRQYRNRFPVHPEVIVSFPILIIDMIGTVVVSGLLVQLFVIYNRTRSVNQGVSGLTKCILTLLIIIFLWSTKCYIMEQKALFLLDIIDFLWFVSKFTLIIRYIPQIFMNWFDSCVVGHSDSFLAFQSISLLCLAFSKFALISEDWFNIPVNYNTWSYLVSGSVCLLILFLQERFLYHGKKPSLDLMYIASETFHV
ncbi:uncharacterized protein PRCAT00000836001 [Priceomyces carsonii]|uniref:uncharacterized protein n=1 Tax=Priceomyces carsonii TaxID=28549 RepID=UPI002ED7726A|nr:unnamed protein product [Priceomyces carsonii]